MTQPRKVNPPRHLSTSSRRWFRGVVDVFELEAHHVKILTLACEAWDRAQQARQEILEHGMTYKDRFDAPRAHPAVAIERDARLAFARLVRELDLDADTTPATTRPPAIRSNRR
jgi:P27 family predicted phage terminase small subunit